MKVARERGVGCGDVGEAFGKVGCGVLVRERRVIGFFDAEGGDRVYVCHGGRQCAQGAMTVVHIEAV